MTQGSGKMRGLVDKKEKITGFPRLEGKLKIFGTVAENHRFTVRKQPCPAVQTIK
jgi:hypothetical protein